MRKRFNDCSDLLIYSFGLANAFFVYRKFVVISTAKKINIGIIKDFFVFINFIPIALYTEEAAANSTTTS